MSIFLVWILISRPLSAPGTGAGDQPGLRLPDHSQEYNSLSRNILHAQIPDTFAGFYIFCQRDSAYLFHTEVADDITVTDSYWEIDNVITWWEGWNGFVTWNFVPNTILLYLRIAPQEVRLILQ